jgi:hypothetical protein
MSLDQMFENTTRHVGNRVTRRSFMGRMALAMGAVGVGGLAFAPSPSLATECGCSVCGDTTSCGGSRGHSCPGGTCAGGSWYMCTSFCAKFYYTRYQDCMSSNCSPYCGSDGRPGCYYHTPYGSCGGSTTVWCRAITCLGPAPCE